MERFYEVQWVELGDEKDLKIIAVSGLHTWVRGDAARRNADMERENQCKTLSEIIALHCKCSVLILKSYFTELFFKGRSYTVLIIQM